MSEEKITNEEILKDEELEEVAGGTGAEIRDDKQKFEKLGIKITNGDNEEAQLKDAFARFGVQMETYHGYLSKNEYWIDGHSVSRHQAWEHIYSQVR